MNKFTIAILLCSVMALQSCTFWETVVSVFTKSCTKNTTDKYVFRASVEVMSPNLQLAQEKAIAEAKRELIRQVDEYIAENISYKDFLRDGKYEKKIDAVRDKVVAVCENSCSHQAKKSSQIVYSVTLQINRATVDDIISAYK